jgi:hypothetical protein
MRVVGDGTVGSVCGAPGQGAMSFVDLRCLRNGPNEGFSVDLSQRRLPLEMQEPGWGTGLLPRAASRYGAARRATDSSSPSGGATK